MAILKTTATGLLYLFIPIPAKYYISIIGTDYIGYVAAGSSIMIIGNLILLVRAWALAFDKELRKEYHEK